MRRTTSMLALWALLSSAARAAPEPAAPAARARPAKLVVMEIRPLGTEPAQAELLTEVALTELARYRALEVIGQSDIASIAGLERQKQLLGCGEELSCLAELAGAVGAEYMLVGSLGKLGALHRLDLKLIDARKARVLGRQGESVDGEEKLVASVQRATRELARIVAGPGEPGGGPATRRFDGTWAVHLACPVDERTRARGYAWDFEARVESGQLKASYGAPEGQGSLELEGPIREDGTALLAARGRTGDPSFSVANARPGTPYTYHVRARFEGARGSGRRLEHRTCELTFARK